MWKYVSRVKETFERSYVFRSWACGAQDHRVQSAANFGQQANLGPDDYVCVALPTTHGRSDVTYYRCEKFADNSREKGRRGHHRRGCVVGDLLGAITWSGAIICGWYASQLLCLHRRHAGWENPRYMQILNIPTRAFHSNLLSHCVLASPNHSSLVSERTLHDKFAAANLPLTAQAAIFDVNNDNDCGNRGPTLNDETQKQQNVDNAVADLVTFLGETEYKMGVKNLSVGQYRSAVAHLKLATSHNHPGATFNLGLCYEKGLGVAKNLKRAMECYQLASSMGHSKAMYNLGVFYARGLGGLEKDRQAAKQCFITAAKLGQPEAIDALGVRVERSTIQPSVDTDFPPMTELLFEKGKAELYAAAAKFT